MKTKKQTLVIALAMMLALTIAPIMAFSQEKDDNQLFKIYKTRHWGCKKVMGNESVVNNGDGTTSGTITQGGRLNGTTRTIFTSAFTPTPDPNTFSFTDDLTVTTNKGVLTNWGVTNKGVLQTHNVSLFDTANGVFSAIARIDPNTSTENFDGATGVLYINGKTTDGGATFQGEITGEICFAN